MPFIHGLRTRRTQKKNRQKKLKKNSSNLSSKSSKSSKSAESHKLSRSPRTIVKRLIAATKIQRTLKTKNIQKINKEIKTSLKNSLNLTNSETQIYMHLFKKLGDNRDTPDIILEYIRNQRIINQQQNMKKILMINDILEIFYELQSEFDSESTKELDEYSYILTELLEKIESQQIPLYSNEMTELLNTIIRLKIPKIVNYLENNWMEYFDTQYESLGLTALTHAALKLDEFLTNYYNNGPNKYY